MTGDGEHWGYSQGILRRGWQERPHHSARSYLADDLLFIGLFETYRSADAYIRALTGLLSITVRIDVKKIITQGNDGAIFFELQTKDPAKGTVLVAEWHQFIDGKIAHVESAFDGRPYEAMFSSSKDTVQQGVPPDHV